MTQATAKGPPRRAWCEFLVAAVALFALLLAEALLCKAIHATNFTGTDGKMAQALVLAAFKLGGLFSLTNINPLMGVGSQLLPINVWINPTYWPFMLLERQLATDVAAIVALGIFASACYFMARCFDLPPVISAIAAQLCIFIFSPLLLIFGLSTVFTLLVGNAVVYAPYMVALGLLCRLEPGSWRDVIGTGVAIFVLVLYSLACDPLWSVIGGFNWATAFAVVVFGDLRLKTVAFRLGALACSFALLLASRSLEYVYTLTRYTARVQFPALGDRARAPDLMLSTIFYSPDAKYFYATWAIGWLLGLLTLGGRSRLLVVAAVASFIVYAAGAITYVLLLNATWQVPIPAYTEQGLFVLFMTAAVAGYWGALRRCASSIGWLRRWIDSIVEAGQRAQSEARPGAGRAVAVVLACVLVMITPGILIRFAIERGEEFAERYHERFPPEPELGEYLEQRVGLADGKAFEGSVQFWNFNYDISLTIDNLWLRGVPTISEYSQLVSPPPLYFVHAVLQNNVVGALNGFVPFKGSSWAYYCNVLQMFGARFYITDKPSEEAKEAELPVVTMPRRPHWSGPPPGLWYIYEFPQPNLGNYSPTNVIVARQASDIAAIIGKEDFDFTSNVVVTAPVSESLVPASDVRMSWRRGRWHVAARSGGTSLLLLPQQFSNCLRPKDPSVRLVRADLMMTGMIFSGDVDTDIVFDNGIFSPGCRRYDLADLKELDLHIPGRVAHLTGPMLPDWNGVMTRMRAAVAALK